MKEKSYSFSTFEGPVFIVTGLTIVASLILTLIAFIQLCSEACAGTHDYRIFGLHFEIFGFLFFGLLAVIYVLSRMYTPLTWVVEILFASALGAETVFILIQKNQMESWCPICLAIASCMFIGAAALGVRRVNTIKKKGKTMKNMLKGFISMAAILVGFAVAFVGITRYDPLEAAQRSIKESLAFGKKDSPINVYLFTDWTCSACRNLEPKVKKLSQQIMKEGNITFVDFAVNPETLNFIPYHLAFILHNKPEYFQLRDMLTKLSQTTTSPSDQEISAAAEKLGVQYKKIDYSDVALGIKYFKKLAEKFKIKGTPTMVIVNIDTKKGKKLTGNREITQGNIAKAIKQLKN